MGITRREMYQALGLIKIVDPILNKAVERIQREKFESSEPNSPHGEPWHTSFHASQFPGDDVQACPRQAVYQMADFAQKEPNSRFLNAVADTGTAIETLITNIWADEGILISTDHTKGRDIQTGFSDDEHWFTGSVDALIVPPGWDSILPIEIKSKALDKVIQMKRGQKPADPSHINQASAYIGFSHEELHKRFPVLRICKSTGALAEDISTGECRRHGVVECLKTVNTQPTNKGVIYYVARDDFSVTHEFLLDYNPEFMKVGRERLKDWQNLFELGIIQQDQEKKHPLEGWAWSTGPCKFCPYKKEVCKPDFVDGITNLEESNGIKWTESVRGSYDLEATVQRVKDRWNVDEED